MPGSVSKSKMCLPKLRRPLRVPGRVPSRVPLRVPLNSVTGSFTRGFKCIEKKTLEVQKDFGFGLVVKNGVVCIQWASGKTLETPCNTRAEAFIPLIVTLIGPFLRTHLGNYLVAGAKGAMRLHVFLVFFTALGEGGGWGEG